MFHLRHRFAIASTGARWALFAIALALTLVLMGLLSHIADRQVAQSEADQAVPDSLQLVVVTGEKPGAR
jgi:hypothetical protein